MADLVRQIAEKLLVRNKLISKKEGEKNLENVSNFNESKSINIGTGMKKVPPIYLDTGSLPGDTTLLAFQ